MAENPWRAPSLLLLGIYLACAVGCMTVRKPDSGSSVSPASWLERTRKQFAVAYAEIQQDLNFHENEALDQFAPGATQQVEVLRSSMNGPGGIERKAFY